MSAKHKITALRAGSHPKWGDWEKEHTITFSYTPGRPEVRYLRNGDPGYPADPPEVEFVSIDPGASDVGVFTDLAQKDLEDWASDWLQTDGYEAALAVAAEDDEAGREYAAELRADR